MADYTKTPNGPGSPADGCLDWDSVIENDGQEYVTLPEGDYIFTVTDFERGRFPGSAKIRPCNKAILTLEVTTPEGIARIREDLILYRSMEWKISAFFRCIGQKQRGERVAMNWTSVVGARGRAHFKPRAYKTADGAEHTANSVDRYIDYDSSKMQPDDPDTPSGLEDDEYPF